MNTNILSMMKKIPAELNGGGTSTTEKVFQDSASAAVVLPLPSASELCGVNAAHGKKSARFKVIATGRATGGAASNFTVKLYYGTSTTVASNTQIGASTARALASASHNWTIEADITWDSSSNKMQGWFTAMVANLVDAPAALSNTVTSADPDDSSTQGFVVSGTFSSGNASHTANLDSFVLISVA